MGEMMASLKEKMGPDKILLGNNANQAIAKHVFPVIDANMFEHYNEELLSKEKSAPGLGGYAAYRQGGEDVGLSDRCRTRPQLDESDGDQQGQDAGDLNGWRHWPRNEWNTTSPAT